jgi:hypothetical protein
MHYNLAGIFSSGNVNNKYNFLLPKVTKRDTLEAEDK